MKKIKQYFCNHKNIEVENVVTEKNKTVLLGKCMRCGKEQLLIIRAAQNEIIVKEGGGKIND